MKPGRNQSCPCGSGKKYKRCHGKIAPLGPSDAEIRHVLERHRAAENIRINQQGHGRPIIGAKLPGHQVVAVGNKIYWSPAWKTFSDFLSDYIKRVIDPAWGNTEIAKTFEERHPLMQWYDTFARYQQSTITKPGEVHSATVTGIVACYLGLAYSLYLLAHNVELQERLIHRLKDPANFQGAYYELIVANILIRAGFKLTLEDETDSASKHCEFAAVSVHTGKRYWVEAKMRAVVGFFGKTAVDGSTEQNPISQLVPHLNAALAKPAADERLIFIDLNALPDANPSQPVWGERAVRRLEQYESSELRAGVQAYVFVTNFSFHRDLHGTPSVTGMPFGLGIADFNRQGFIRLLEAYRQKKKHLDAHKIGEAFTRYLRFPQTFDGRMPSEAFNGSDRLLIGETYLFDDENGGQVTGTVTTASVNESESKIYIGVTEDSGRTTIRSQPMLAAELADYRANSESYFGKVQSVSRKITTKFELFEWLFESNKTLTRETLLERLAVAPDFEEFKDADDGELLARYSEGMVGAFEVNGFKTEG